MWKHLVNLERQEGEGHQEVLGVGAGDLEEEVGLPVEEVGLLVVEAVLQVVEVAGAVLPVVGVGLQVCQAVGEVLQQSQEA